ncbi:MAG: hypothetical protein ACQESB_00095 [Elusimicrobiota bacterium]
MKFNPKTGLATIISDTATGIYIDRRGMSDLIEKIFPVSELRMIWLLYLRKKNTSIKKIKSIKLISKTGKFKDM